MAKPKIERPTFSNTIGLPDELIPLIERSHVCEYASNKADGTPITTALSPAAGTDGRTIDINTGITYPLKAERARRDSRVCLLFSEPEALLGDQPPVALVFGLATVRDADIQANTDRYVRVLRATSPSFGSMPGFVLRRMRGYLARIWIEITPERILWWPEGVLTEPPRTWEPAGRQPVPESDPPPKGPRETVAPLVTTDADLVGSVARALSDLGQPILTASDTSGHPVPFRAASGTLEERTVSLELFEHTPPRRDGPACLSFHTVTVENDDMTANENRTYLGTVTFDGHHARFTPDRQTPTISFRPGLRGNIAMIRLMRALNRRLEGAAARHNQPIPQINIPQS